MKKDEEIKRLKKKSNRLLYNRNYWRKKCHRLEERLEDLEERIDSLEGDRGRRAQERAYAMYGDPSLG